MVMIINMHGLINIEVIGIASIPFNDPRDVTSVQRMIPKDESIRFFTKGVD
jgi:hypothetical protein